MERLAGDTREGERHEAGVFMTETSERDEGGNRGVMRGACERGFENF